MRISAKNTTRILNFGVNKDLTPGISLGRIWFGKIVSDVWKGPVVVHQFQIHGPLPVSFQSKAQRYFSMAKETLPVDLSLAFSRFAEELLDPVKQAEIKPYLQIEKDARLKLGAKPEKHFSLPSGYISIPRFSLLKGRIKSSQQAFFLWIANRLSHFFWSS